MGEVDGDGEVRVLLNPASGKGAPEDVRALLAEAFDPLGRRWRIVELPGGPDSRAAASAAIAAAGDRDLIVAGGGDGTVSLVADALVRAGRGLTLGIVPLGTANVLARELRVPVEPREAVLLLAAGHRAVDLDAMRIGGHHYVTQVGVGPDALMIAETSREAQRRFGRLAYMAALLRRALGHRSRRFRFTIDGRLHRLRAWQVVLANARTLGAPPFTWGPSVDPTDGVLDLCVYNVSTPRDYVRALWTVLTHRHREDPNSRYLPVRRSVRIECIPPMPVQADGESLGDTPVEVEVAPRALRVLAPAEPEAADPAIRSRREHLWRVALRAGWSERVATLGHVDAAVFLWMNRLPRHRWLDRLMTEVSAAMPHGEGWLVFLGIAMLADLREGWRATLAVVPAMWLATLTVNYPIKALFRRRRPFAGDEETVVVGHRPADPSFPSGHTAAAFAGALLLSIEYPAWSPLCYAVAVLVGFSRVYLGVHFPLDVAAGAVAGMVLGALYRGALVALVPWLRG